MLRFAAEHTSIMIGCTDVLGVLSVKAFRVKIEFRMAFKWFLPLMKRINFHYSYSNNRMIWHGMEHNGSELVGIYHFNGIAAHVRWCECVMS